MRELSSDCTPMGNGSPLLRKRAPTVSPGELLKHATHRLRVGNSHWSKKLRFRIKLEAVSQLPCHNTLLKVSAQVQRADQQLSRPNLEFEQYSELVVAQLLIDYLRDGAIVMLRSEERR